MAAASVIDTLEPEEGHGYEYDLLVIGGGSGGLALAQEAARKDPNKKIGVFDFVSPSPQGTTWGLGGTCVNVGCIPKKLMHHASLVGESFHDGIQYGWQIPEDIKIKWDTLVTGIQDHIGSLNWGYRVALREKKVEYINAKAVFLNPHTVQATTRGNKVTQHTARRFAIAVGGRPKQLEIPGGEHCITSDDLFSREVPPGKTLVVGASYVALECAGFIRAMGFPVSVMARSIFLRGFDQQMANMATDYMEQHHVTFIRPAVPSNIQKMEDGRLKVFWKNADTGEQQNDVFDTVLVAVGRRADTDTLGLEHAGVVYDKNGDGKIPVGPNEQTNVPHIYALGDVIKGNLELTPVAIKAGRLLARRLFTNSKVLMDYRYVPTTVFTPLEYGACGYAEETAIKEFGEENIEVYHSYFKPLEWTVTHREDNACYCKLITNKLDNERVIGVHYLGPNAGEVIQGYGVAVKAGATKDTFDLTVGIHPTCSEEFTTLNVTKRSGAEAKKTGC